MRTPYLDRLAGEGVAFRQAVTPSPLCSPARACLATGRDYHRCGVRDNGQNTPLELPTYYQHLRAAGYEVSGVGKFDLHKADSDWGLDGSKLLEEYGFTRGIDNEGKGDAIHTYRNHGRQPVGPYMNYLAQRGLAERHVGMYEPHMGQGGWLNFPAVTELPDEAYCDNWVAANALRELEGFGEERPWHLVVNFVGPHGPFDVTRRMRKRWQEVDFPPPVDNTEANPEVILERQQNYAAMIENIDTHLGRMLEVVEARGELDRTVVVYASDHGEMLGDHNRWAKSVWYQASAGVPLIVQGPGIPGGKTSDALVSLHDLAATFLDLGGAEALPASDARTLRPVLEGASEEHREYLLSGLMGWRMVSDGRFKLVMREGEESLLYDRQEDPTERRNIASLATDQMARLQAILEREHFLPGHWEAVE